MDTGMVFGIIFAIIVIGLLLVFGIDQIVNIFCLSSTAQTDKAVKDLENAVENVFNLGEGSALPFKVAIPRDSKICLVNYEDPAPMNNWNPHPDDYNNWLRDMLLDKRYNIWIEYGCSTMDDGYSIRYLTMSENFCAGAGEELYIENKGYYVTIEPPLPA